MHREILNADRYQEFYLYIVDILGETLICNWESEQTCEIMKRLYEHRADLVECLFLKRFLTIEHHGRGINRQIERLIVDAEEINTFLTKCSEFFQDDTSKFFLNLPVTNNGSDIDCFTTSPKRAKNFFDSTREKEQALKEKNNVYGCIEGKIQESLKTLEEARNGFVEAAKKRDYEHSIKFTYVSVVDEVIVVREYSLQDLQSAYDDQENNNGESKIIGRYLVDGLVNGSRCEVREISGGIKILCTQKNKNKIENSSLLRKIYQKSDARKSGVIVIANYVTEKNKIRLNENVSQQILFEDIDFQGDVVLDGVNFSGSLTFRRCRFMSRLSIKDASIEGSMIIERCMLYGNGSLGSLNAEKEDKEKSTLVAHGLSVAKSCFITSSIISGSVKGQWLKIGNILRLRDTRIYNNRQGISTSQDLVKLGYARVGGPVVLESSLDECSGIYFQSYIEGHCLLPGLKADSLHLNGLYIDGNLDLEAARIQSTFAIASLTKDDSPSSGWLTHIGRDLILRYAHCELVRMTDVHILGKLILEEAEVEHSVQLNTLFESGGRCIIHGDADLDGAIIKGEISIRGAHIGGDLSLITGTFGRIYANATWIKNSSPKGDSLTNSYGILKTEVFGSIYLADCSTGSLALVGIEVKENIVTNNLVVNGRMRFWGTKRIEMMKKEAEEHMVHQFCNDTFEKIVYNITANIEEKIDLENATISGGVDFAKSSAESIILDGATLGSNVNFYTNISKYNPVTIREEASFKNTTISGELDMRGLKIENGDLNAKNSLVKGEILLATRDGKYIEKETLILGKGNINLEGSRASSVRISYSCLAKDARLKYYSFLINSEQNKKEKRKINISRARLGQLTIYGLEKREKFIANIDLDLYAAEVEDWNLINEKGKEDHELCFTLLSATNDNFDARNYLDIEKRLHAIGKTSLSNRVYREMGININRSNSIRSKDNVSQEKNIHEKVVINKESNICEKDKSPIINRLNLLKSHNAVMQWLSFIMTPGIVLFNYMVVRPVTSFSKTSFKKTTESIRQTNEVTFEALHRTSDGFLFNWIFTHGRTKPGLMFLWLFLLSIPAFIIACDERNVTAPFKTDSKQNLQSLPDLVISSSEGNVTTPFNTGLKQKTETFDAYRKTVIKGNDSCPTTYHVSENDWHFPKGIVKSIGIAATYAVPLYHSAKLDKAQLRTTGCTYMWEFDIACFSPHDISQIFSMFQFALWLLIAANLPAIIRRRG